MGNVTVGDKLIGVQHEHMSKVHVEEDFVHG
jgi:hypothetical protein